VEVSVAAAKQLLLVGTGEPMPLNASAVVAPAPSIADDIIATDCSRSCFVQTANPLRFPRQWLWR
jgi:hypothetical protein